MFSTLADRPGLFEKRLIFNSLLDCVGFELDFVLLAATFWAEEDLLENECVDFR